MVYIVVLLGIAIIAVITGFTVGRKIKLLGSDEAIAKAARNGELIVAIKSYRALHGVGLKQAKQRVLALAAGSMATPPN